MGNEECVRPHDKRTYLLLGEGCKSRVDLAFAARVDHLDLPPEHRSSLQHIGGFGGRVWIGRIN